MVWSPLSRSSPSISVLGMQLSPYQRLLAFFRTCLTHQPLDQAPGPAIAADLAVPTVEFHGISAAITRRTGEIDRWPLDRSAIDGVLSLSKREAIVTMRTVADHGDVDDALAEIG